jgi:hypothetical protein
VVAGKFVRGSHAQGGKSALREVPMKIRMQLVGALMSLFAVDATAQAPEAWLGTWKLNVEKSKFSPGPPPKSMIVKSAAAAGGGFTYTSDMVAADGKTTHVEYFSKPDGKDYPMKTATTDAIWLKKIDDYTNQFATKMGGKVVATGRTVYSRDGKLRTQTWTVTNAQGDKVESTAVFDRQ